MLHSTQPKNRRIVTGICQSCFISQVWCTLQCHAHLAAAVTNHSTKTTAEDAAVEVEVEESLKLRGKCVTRSLGHAQHTLSITRARASQQVVTAHIRDEGGTSEESTGRWWGCGLRYRVSSDGGTS